MTSTFQYDIPSAYDTDVSYDAYAPTPTPVAIIVLPHLDAQLAIGGDGSFAWNTQDSLADVQQCVEMIVGTQVGERTMVPTFGVTDPTFIYPVDKNEILQQITTFEPRATVAVNVAYTEGTSNVQVAVSLVRGSTS